MDKPPVDVMVSGIGKLGISANCKGYGKLAVFQTHSIVDVGNPGYKCDFMSRVRLEYDCCKDFDVKVNISKINVNTTFKHVVSHLDDLKVASRRISDVEYTKRGQERKWLHTSSRNAYSTFTHVCLLLLVLYVLYKLYYCLKNKAHCEKAIADSNRSRNVVNIKIHTSNESLAMAQEVPFRDLNSQYPEVTLRRSNRLRISKSCF
jgi:hypothetical protein